MFLSSTLENILYIFIALISGLSVFYLLSNQTRQLKRQQIQEIVSEIINFIIFIWIGKIIFNLARFLTDPLAVLAYPSDSKAFYFAVVMMTLLFIYKVKQKKIDVILFMYSFIPVFLIASFLYEFIQLGWNRSNSLGYIVLLGLLIVLYLYTYERLYFTKFIRIMLIGWMTGLIILFLIQASISIFNYTIDFWFVFLFLVLYLVSIFIHLRKRVEK